MKAIVCTKYGPPEVLQLKEAEKPVPKNNEVLIKIYDSAATASDSIIRGFKIPVKHWFPKGMIMSLMMRLVVGFKKPRHSILGLVFAGKIESVGKNVKRFRKGDQVYGFTGYGFGAYAEYKCMSVKDTNSGCLATMPTNISYEEAAAISYGGLIAMHFIKMGPVRYGKKVLIYGASGAIGTCAVQLARYYGAEVTGVCSTKNIELVESLGAHKVIDYTMENSIEKVEKYDFILDAVGEIKSSDLKIHCKNALTKNGKYISVDDGSIRLRSEYLIQLNEIIEVGHVKAVIDSTYPLEHIVEAHRYVDEGHKKGNVVISIRQTDKS